jgi:hypothetical protein
MNRIIVLIPDFPHSTFVGVYRSGFYDQSVKLPMKNYLTNIFAKGLLGAMRNF